MGRKGSEARNRGEMGAREQNEVNVLTPKPPYLQSGVFATGYSREGLDTAYTGKDPIPDLKHGSAK